MGSSFDGARLRMFEAYVYDYLLKKNCPATAETFLQESGLTDPRVAIDTPESFLADWWSIFHAYYFKPSDNNVVAVEDPPNPDYNVAAMERSPIPMEMNPPNPPKDSHLMRAMLEFEQQKSRQLAFDANSNKMKGPQTSPLPSASMFREGNYVNNFYGDIGPSDADRPNFSTSLASTSRVLQHQMPWQHQQYAGQGTNLGVGIPSESKLPSCPSYWKPPPPAGSFE